MEFKYPKEKQIHLISENELSKLVIEDNKIFYFNGTERIKAEGLIQLQIG